MQFRRYKTGCSLTICNFRKLPQPRNEQNEMASEPSYFVDENDVFPEEFKFFLGFPDDLRQVFLSVHSDLFNVDFWRNTQQNILTGKLIHISPYSSSIRLKINAFHPIILHLHSF